MLEKSDKIIDAKYASLDNRDVVECRYKRGHVIELDIMLTSEPRFKILEEQYGLEKILENTKTEDQRVNQFFEDVEQFRQWKRDGKITIETKANDVGLSFDKIYNATTEDLFKIKLEIFEKESVQNCENKDLRSQIRKAKSIPELLFLLQLIEFPEESKVIIGETSSDINLNANQELSLDVLQNTTAENLFKLKLQIFELDAIQNCEDREKRSALRKSTDIFELCSAYNEIIKNVDETTIETSTDSETNVDETTIETSTDSEISE